MFRRVMLTEYATTPSSPPLKAGLPGSFRRQMKNDDQLFNVSCGESTGATNPRGSQHTIPMYDHSCVICTKVVHARRRLICS